MSIDVYEITGRRPRFIGALANVNDFFYAAHHPGATHRGDHTIEGTIADAYPVATLDTEQFLCNPNFSLYCFDETQNCAIFVELPPSLDLAQVSFVHQVQYEEALRVVCVPFQLFNQMAAALPPVPQPIFLYMSARSGSTLLSRIFNTSGVVTSLSEPDAITQFVHLRECGSRRGAETDVSEESLHILADSTMRFFFRPQADHSGGSLRLAQAVKFRSEGIRMLDLFQRVFPQAKNLFLYRDALGWVNSFHRIFTNLNFVEPLTIDEWQSLFEGFLHTNLAHLRAYIPPQRTHLSLVEQLTLWWIAIMEWYWEQWEAGIPVMAIRYNDLNWHRARTLHALFDYCNLPKDAVQPALDAFANDSQAGTVVARNQSQSGAILTLSQRAIGEIMAILHHHPYLNHSDIWLPGTLALHRYPHQEQALSSSSSDLPSPERGVEFNLAT